MEPLYNARLRQQEDVVPLQDQSLLYKTHAVPQVIAPAVPLNAGLVSQEAFGRKETFGNAAPAASYF
jgi:hypothetical protein